MNRPYIYCHMMESLDGRIECSMLENLEGGDEYYKVLEKLPTHSTISGKITAKLELASGIYKEDNYIPYNKGGYKVNKESNKYEIIFDTLGSLCWDNYDANLIIVTSKKVSTNYLKYLDNLNISYIISDNDKIDINYTIDILYTKFNIKNLVLVGGGNINATFLNLGLIDEISIILAPGIDGRKNKTALFDGLSDDTLPFKLKLKSVETFNNGSILIKYLTK